MEPIYIPRFVGTEILTDQVWLNNLMSLPWENRTTARFECFLSDHKIEYSYGARQSRAYVSGPLNQAPLVRDILIQVNEKLYSHSILMDKGNPLWGPMNGCFLNRYDNAHQALGWHADDFEGMDHTKAVAVVSLGQAREIWWRTKGQSGKIPDNQKRLLDHGSLFIMPPGFQFTHDHRIPKGDREMGRRISLTYRAFK